MGSVGALPVSLPATTVPLDRSDEFDEVVILLDWSIEFDMVVVLLDWSDTFEAAEVVEKSPNESNRLPKSPNELNWFVICARSVSPLVLEDVCEEIERET